MQIAQAPHLHTHQLISISPSSGGWAATGLADSSPFCLQRPSRELLLHGIGGWGVRGGGSEEKEKGREGANPSRQRDRHHLGTRKKMPLSLQTALGEAGTEGQARGLAGVGLRLARLGCPPGLVISLALASWAGDWEAGASVSPFGKRGPHTRVCMSPGRWQRLLLLLLLQTQGRERAVESVQTALPAYPLLWGWGVRLPLPLCLSVPQFHPVGGTSSSSLLWLFREKQQNPWCLVMTIRMVIMMIIGMLTAWCASGNPGLAKPSTWIFSWHPQDQPWARICRHLHCTDEGTEARTEPRPAFPAGFRKPGLSPPTGIGLPSSIPTPTRG